MSKALNKYSNNRRGSMSVRSNRKGSSSMVVSHEKTTYQSKKRKYGKAICALIAIDVSGSMQFPCPDGGSRLENAKKGLRDLLNGLKRRGHNGDLIHLFVFDDKTHVRMPWTRASDVDVERAVTSIRGGGATALYDTIFKMIQDCKAKFKARPWTGTTELFVLTDGQDVSSSKTLEETRNKLAHPGIPNFYATLLSVDMPPEGQQAMDSMASAARHVRTMSVRDSGSNIRRAYTTVLGQMIERTRTVIVMQTETVIGGGRGRGRGQNRGRGRGRGRGQSRGRGRGRGGGRGRGRGRGRGNGKGGRNRQGKKIN